MKIYQAINAVQQALSQQGIEKSQRNNQGAGYNFRGIDQVYNTLSPLLAKHGLCILPRVIKSEQAERQSAKGSALIYSYVTMEFDLVSAEDGSKHTVCTVGEAFDSGDKSMNKAMSAAYKYACFQSFAIPTEGDNDADAHSHELAPKQQSTITEDQQTVIEDLLKETDTEKTKFFQWVSEKSGAQVICVANIPAAAYEPCVKVLKSKKDPK